MSIKRTFWNYLLGQQLVASLMVIGLIIVTLIGFIQPMPTWITPILSGVILLVGGLIMFRRITKGDVARFSQNLLDFAKKYRDIYSGGKIYSAPSLARSVLRDTNIKNKYGEVLIGWELYFYLIEDIIVRRIIEIEEWSKSYLGRGNIKDFKAIIDKSFDGLIRKAEDATSAFFALHRTFSNEWSSLAEIKNIEENYRIFSKKYNDLIDEVRKFADELEASTDIHIYKDALILIKEGAYEFEPKYV